MTNDTFLQRLDAIVRWTGVPALTEQPPRRRPMRWPSAVALALALGGYGVSVAQNLSGSGTYLGYGIGMIGFAVGTFVRILGPIKPSGSFVEKIDEWDRAIQARAYLMAFKVFAVTTMVALCLLMGGLAFDVPKDAVMQGGIQTMFLLFTIINAVPAAYASWAVRWENVE
ncbi:hypothetical protein [Sphingomonas sp. PB1R3]|uniref:hypothetical protein n=1 Tax=Sphingomonas flavida TaxID=3096154 RepID=UPI002FC6E41E